MYLLGIQNYLTIFSGTSITHEIYMYLFKVSTLKLRRYIVYIRPERHYFGENN